MQRRSSITPLRCEDETCVGVRSLPFGVKTRRERRSSITTLWSEDETRVQRKSITPSGVTARREQSCSVSRSRPRV